LSGSEGDPLIDGTLPTNNTTGGIVFNTPNGFTINGIPEETNLDNITHVICTNGDNKLVRVPKTLFNI